MSDLTLTSRDPHISSFAIEKEAPSEDKARQFVELLKQAHEPRELSEDYLVELQNVITTNPFDKAASFRYEQNWLSGPGRGAPSVTYLPTPHELALHCEWLPNRKFRLRSTRHPPGASSAVGQ
ncbi:hypothetical protein IFT74_02935 [Oxalobacteraceae sp. CFBP 8755]|nr:hypothetical protein [Oxalobacteraceae sp. CFBP 8755]